MRDNRIGTTTEFVTFPLPNARHVLDIKLGRLPYQEVACEIEDLLVGVEAAAAISKLPDEPDKEWIERFVFDCYRTEVFESRYDDRPTADFGRVR